MKRFLPFCLLILAAVDVSGAQVNAPSNRSGTWSAANSSGVTFMGTWTAVLDSTGATVTGTWTVGDTQGKTLAYGGWSAAKSLTQWTGAWRAVVAGRNGESSGTWTAAVELKGDTRFVDLVEKAVLAAVSGTWRGEGQSGAWSVRAAKRDGPP